MPQPNRRDPSPLPPIAQRRCPSCGLHLFLSRIEPTDRADYEERIYECQTCAYGETVTVKFR
jgi:DNA-directed RNA polymerase subunit M/transcription elongation factor TFIIS